MTLTTYRSLRIAFGKGAECRVQRVRWDAADRPADDVALDQSGDLQQLTLRQDLVLVVGVDLQQERVDAVRRFLAQVSECLGQAAVRLRARAERDGPIAA